MVGTKGAPVHPRWCGVLPCSHLSCVGATTAVALPPRLRGSLLSSTHRACCQSSCVSLHFPSLPFDLPQVLR